MIEAHRLSKRYTLGTIGATSFKEELPRLWRRFWNNRGEVEAAPTDFWALSDVSFDIAPGEVVGVIGRNGAGKSTLLKILSRITRQTSGVAVLRGRIASLLEVGTGFHPDLTGRENVFLNGAILGMTKAEIRQKLDEIVAFAEVDRFVDTPVKRYSSGMYVRLAFAVAAHLEPDILIVDEVLAVGDIAFQKKCLGKMADASRSGRTILFVSHNLPAVQALCHRAILLEHGRVGADGPTDEVVREYLAKLNTPAAEKLATRTDRQGAGTVRVVSARVTAADDSPLITSTSGLKICVEYESAAPVRRLNMIFGLYSDGDVGIYGLESDAAGGLPELLPPRGVVTCVTGPLNLTAGRCVLNVAVLTGGDMVDYVRGMAHLDIEPVDYYGTGKTPGRNWMLGLIDHQWDVHSPSADTSVATASTSAAADR